MERDFVFLDDVLDGIRWDAKYATWDNFTGKPVDGYEVNRVVGTHAVALALQDAQRIASALGYGLLLWDCYRPKRAVECFMRWARQPEDSLRTEGDLRTRDSLRTEGDLRTEDGPRPEDGPRTEEGPRARDSLRAGDGPRPEDGPQTEGRLRKQRFYPRIGRAEIISRGYVAEQSSHSRGSAIDLTLFSLDTGALVPMGGGFDLMDERSHHSAKGLTPAQARNRRRLRSIMDNSGFMPYENEWWHYVLKDEPYPETFFDFPLANPSDCVKALDAVSESA